MPRTAAQRLGKPFAPTHLVGAVASLPAVFHLLAEAPACLPRTLSSGPRYAGFAYPDFLCRAVC
jgi:hypothetical protein